MRALCAWCVSKRKGGLNRSVRGRGGRCKTCGGLGDIKDDYKRFPVNLKTKIERLLNNKPFKNHLCQTAFKLGNIYKGVNDNNNNTEELEQELTNSGALTILNDELNGHVQKVVEEGYRIKEKLKAVISGYLKVSNDDVEVQKELTTLSLLLRYHDDGKFHEGGDTGHPFRCAYKYFDESARTLPKHLLMQTFEDTPVGKKLNDSTDSMYEYIYDKDTEPRAKELAEVVNKFNKQYTNEKLEHLKNPIIIGLAICFHQTFTTPWQWIGPQHLYKSPDGYGMFPLKNISTVEKDSTITKIQIQDPNTFAVATNPVTENIKEGYATVNYDATHAEFLLRDETNIGWHVNIEELKQFLSVIELEAVPMFKRVMYFVYMLSVCDTRSYRREIDDIADPNSDFNTNVEDMWVQLQLILDILDKKTHR